MPPLGVFGRTSKEISWELLDTGSYKFKHEPIYDGVDPDTGLRRWVAMAKRDVLTEAAILTSTDDGVTWTETVYEHSTLGFDNLDVSQRIASDGSVWMVSAIFQITVNGDAYGNSSTGYVAISTDRGITWSISGAITKTATGMPMAYSNFTNNVNNKIVTNRDGVWYAYGGSISPSYLAVFTSTDNGVTWEEHTNKFPQVFGAYSEIRGLAAGDYFTVDRNIVYNLATDPNSDVYSIEPTKGSIQQLNATGYATAVEPYEPDYVDSRRLHYFSTDTLMWNTGSSRPPTGYPDIAMISSIYDSESYYGLSEGDSRQAFKVHLVQDSETGRYVHCILNIPDVYEAYKYTTEKLSDNVVWYDPSIPMAGIWNHYGMISRSTDTGTCMYLATDSKLYRRKPLK